MGAHTRWFDQYVEERDRPLVGGKCASLGTMQAAGLPVPPGFAVTTTAYESLWDHEDLTTLIRSDLAALDPDDTVGLRRVADEIRGAIEAVPMPGTIEDDIRRDYERLCVTCAVDDVPVAVRSSGSAEDLPDASFAGQQDTYLWVCGADEVVANVRRCWSSLFTDRAIAYRHQMGYDHQVISMAVAVQKMVDPKAAGVAFTLNPQDGDRSQVAIDASWGLGEAVVSGEVTPDNFLVDKVLRSVVRRIVSDKAIEYRQRDGHVEKVPIEDERRTQPCLTDDEICAVAALARRAEKHYGCPQDVEWAIDQHLPDGSNVVLLQARPETVWSRRPVTPLVDGSYDPMRSIVATLVAPIKANT